MHGIGLGIMSVVFGVCKFSPVFLQGIRECFNAVTNF